MILQTLLALTCSICTVTAFVGKTTTSGWVAASSRTTSLSASVSSVNVEESVSQLKKVLEREYVSFFDPMRTEYYATDVTFDDPLNSLSGIPAYQGNVDMLASRTLLGSVLFQDAGINLHSIEGGKVLKDGSIEDIITRWTLRVTVKILPWKPTARFSGISVYKVEPTTSQGGGGGGVVIKQQTDYWDSINMSNGNYQKVDKGLAIADFLNQLKPGGVQAQAAGAELPFELLRRGKDYEVRRYPSFSAAQIAYEKRDEGFGTLGAFTRGMNPLAPAVIDVMDGTKTMMWPLTFAPPGQTEPPKPKAASDNSCTVITVPSKVVAVTSFTDASMEPVVREADRQLRQALKRDGIQISENDSGSLKFAQYDAIYSMGQRRGEVWIELQDGTHPW